MAEMNYRLIVSDFDGTLRKTEGGISDGNIGAIEDYIAAGGVFAFCTGRMLTSIMPYAKQLGLKGLVVAYQGAVIADIESGKLLRDVRMDAEGSAGVCDYLQELGRHIHVYDGKDVYMNRDDEYKRYYEKVCGVSGILTGEDVASVVREKGIRPQKVLSMNAAEENTEIFALVNGRFKDRYEVTSSSDFLVEVTSFGCNKGGALEFLAGYYGIPMEKTIAVGDSLNDLPMLEFAGIGVAMANGEAHIKAAADMIAEDCNHFGAAKILEQLLKERA